MLALCFADYALVHDEHRDYHGLDGDFHGSPVQVDYTFTLARDKIISLAIE